MRQRLLGAATVLAGITWMSAWSTASAAEAAPEPLMPSLAQIAVAQLKPTPLDTDVVPTGPLTLSWNRIAPPHLVRYDVHFGTESPPPEVSHNQEEVEWTVSESLAPGTYYWRVVARTASGEECAGPLCCFCVPHWLQACVEGTEVGWIIQHPGIFAAPVSHIAVRSNAFVGMHMGATDDLESAGGKEIQTWYSFGDDLCEANKWGWTAAEKIDRRCVKVWPLLTCEGWATRHYELWQKLLVSKCTPRGEYANSVVITFCSEP